VFYFQPGHETYPVYHDSRVQQVLRNAVRWAQPTARKAELGCPHVEKPVIKFDV
jgi:trehalose utilization protein